LKNIKKSTWIKLSVVLGLICIYFFVAPVRNAIKQIIFIFSMLDVNAVKGYILSFGIWAPIISFLLMVFQSVAAPLPAFLITFANAGLFGWIKGAILSWTSAMAGAALCFYISRIYGRGVAEKFASKMALDDVEVFFEKYGKNTILVARLLPFVPFDPISYVAGLTPMGFGGFFLATGIGQLPATIVYSYASAKSSDPSTFVRGLLLLFGISVLVYTVRKIWTERQKKADKDKI
jgi:uncharacterized membrane protein YdjX (TVP38/TMEM64 family)